ncbi:hypothetical protein F5Y10DRAFT_286391 [Nemania abortiva]|nr:hypothetical protein F5Y10DRAFT_286391 [Nemania abortiva]
MNSTPSPAVKRTPLPTRRPSLAVQTMVQSRAANPVAKRTPLPKRRLAPAPTSDSDRSISQAASAEPVPTVSITIDLTSASGDEDHNSIGHAISIMAGRTQAPQMQPAPTPSDKSHSSVNQAVDQAVIQIVNQAVNQAVNHVANQAAGTVARRPLPPGRRLLSITVGDIDPTQSPAMRGANGAILYDGRYRCNICCSVMKNTKPLISSHNSKLHPKDPTKGSAYLRQIAQVRHHCRHCNKVSNSLEMFKKHLKAAHPEVGPSVATAFRTE